MPHIIVSVIIGTANGQSMENVTFSQKLRNLQSWHWPRPFWWQLVAFLVGGLLVLVASGIRGWPAPITAVDVEQTRIDVALPPLPSHTSFVQTFRPVHDGLVEVELLLARLHEGGAGTLSMRLHDDRGNLVATRTWPVTTLEHNQPLLLRFPPQPDSAERTYTLSLSGSPDNPFSFWGYTLDVHDGGTLAVPDNTARELRFVTRYRLLALPALRHLAGLWPNSGWLLLALLLMLMPGALLLLLAAPRWDGATWWGMALALGVAVWPLLWYWLTLAGGRWRGWSLVATLIIGWLVVIILWLRRQTRLGLKIAPAHLLLLLLLLVAFTVRLLAVRDLLFPAWVDSTRHALITRIMADQGQIVRDYRPFLPVDRFPYHFGFHTLSAGLLLLGATTLPNLLLIMGQLLNALVPLTVYAAAWLVTQRRMAALIAAFLVALPFFFPAYYVSWGRLTQLAGVLLLPILLALTWRVAAARPPRPPWWLVALLAAGLALIHIRVFLIYLPFAVIAWLVAGRGRGTRALTAATLLALLLAGPRLWELRPTGPGVLSGADSTYNEFPFAYVTIGWEQPFLLAGGVALLLVIMPALRARPWARFSLALAAWSGLVLLLLSYIPAIWLINLNSAYITFFVPLALILGVVGAKLEVWWRRLGIRGAVAYALPGALFTLLLLHGVRQQIDVLNPTTRLARPADLPAITWVDQNLPPDALIAVNSWQWLGATWAGSDGGAWLLPLTGRQTTTPPADYVYSAELLRDVATFNEAAQAVEDWSDPAAARWLAEEGVTHVFVGARGGFFDPAELMDNPGLQAVYNRDGVFVFALDNALSDSH